MPHHDHAVVRRLDLDRGPVPKRNPTSQGGCSNVGATPALQTLGLRRLLYPQERKSTVRESAKRGKAEAYRRMRGLPLSAMCGCIWTPARLQRLTLGWMAELQLLSYIRRHRHINGGRTNLWPSDAAFMPKRSRAAIAPSPRRGTDEVCCGRSDGVACRRCCKWWRGWTEIVALNQAT